MSEVELKFLIEKVMADEVWARVKASKLASGARPITKTLKSVYLDTPQHALNKAGIALRLRRDGRRWIQTVKTGAQLLGGRSQVGEVENPAPGGRVCIHAIPDPSILEKVVRCVDGAPLETVCETVIKRTSNELVLQDGTRAGLAVDVGEIRAGGRSVELSEMEIDLLDGSPRGLFDIASLLAPEGGLRFSRLSIVARGYLLATEGRIDLPLEPRNAKDVVLDASQTAEQAARDMLRECLDQIATNVSVVLQLNDPEGPHQLRIGLRRLRSVFSVFGPVLRCEEMQRLSAEARWLGQEVGNLRDLDVVADDMLGREAQFHPEEPGFQALADHLLRQTGERRERLHSVLAGRRVQSFLIDSACFVETRGWLDPLDFGQTERLAMPVTKLARHALSKRWKKVTRHTSGLETMTVEERHELRKDLKKLRYPVEFFSSLFPAKRLNPFLKALKTLQAVFGDLNDAATLKSMFTGSEIAGVADISAQRAMGWMIGASQARAESSWTGARSSWQDLEQMRQFWR
jgi:inorganic triphosphatase YgiF